MAKAASGNFYITSIITALILVVLIFLSVALSGAPSDGSFKIFKDKLNRFSIKIPVTMEIHYSNPDEIRIYHPKATFRINISIEKRLKEGKPDATAFMQAFKQNLKLETNQLKILKEGQSSTLPGAQAYLIYSYADKRGIRLMQLYQYYATNDRFFQLFITDRVEGFKNLEKVISDIHGSLKILKPDLK